MAEIERPEYWGVMAAGNVPGFMRMTNGAPMIKLYEIIHVDSGRPIAEMWAPTSGGPPIAEKIRKEAILIAYAPVMFWTLSNLAEAKDAPEVVKEIAIALLAAMQEQREKMDGRKEPDA